jgi:sulfite oxidase
VRNHFAVPHIDETSHSIELSGLGFDHPVVYALAELKAMPKRTVTTVLQCAGNRRSELMDVSTVTWSYFARDETLAFREKCIAPLFKNRL